MSAKHRQPIVEVVHELKCYPGPFQAVKDGSKPFEWRKDDRGYQVGDILWLREFDPHHWNLSVGETAGSYTGDELRRTVTYIIREGFGIPDGYCIMGLAAAKEEQARDERDWMNDWHRNMCKKSKPVLVRLIEQEREHSDKLLRELAAKENQAKVLTADEAERIAWMKHSDVVGSPNGVMASHAVWCMAYIRANGYLAPAKEEQERSPTWLGHCSGCKSPDSEGTHQMGTIEHPDLDNAKEEHGKGSGLTVDAVMQAVAKYRQGFGVLGVLEYDEDGTYIEVDELRKALEDLAGNGSDNS